MSDLNPRIYPNQLDFLIDDINSDDHLNSFYDMDKLDGLSRMSASQYWYIRHLLSTNHYFKIKEFLDKFLIHK